MKRAVREFLEQEEATAKARSKEVKREKRKKLDARMTKYFREKAEKIEANGNPAGAEQYRNFWRRFPRYSGAFPEGQ